jgi:hypothetical protein
MTNHPRETLVDRWLEEGALVFDAHPSLARSAAETLARRASPSRWMLDALVIVRGRAVHTRREARVVDASLVVKYARAIAAAVVVGAASLVAGFSLLASVTLAVVAFYWVEVQRVFVVLLGLEGAGDPVRESAALVRAQGGTGVALVRVLRIAAHMLTGGLRGEGFVRSWCVGCIAVVCWYEYARAAGGAPLARWSSPHA